MLAFFCAQFGFLSEPEAMDDEGGGLAESSDRKHLGKALFHHGF